MSQQREAIDTYLLRVLHTLLMERSVTRAAVKLNQSQPAISAAAAPARHHRRSAAGARQIRHGADRIRAAPARAVQNALREIERIKFQQQFRPGHVDPLLPDRLPRLPERAVRADRGRALPPAAPNATLEFHSLGPADYELALEDGKLDIVVGNWPEPPEQLHLSNLFVDEIVCLMSNTHPFAKRGGPRSTST